MNKIHLGDNNEILENKIEDNSVDMIITSPPYDDMRDYEGFSWDFDRLAKNLKSKLKEGGTMVWIVNDKYSKGSRTLSSFRQAIKFQELGFIVHDIMIWEKPVFAMPSRNRYHQLYEYIYQTKYDHIKKFY